MSQILIAGVISVCLINCSAAGQTPSEVQKWSGAQGSVGQNANDVWQGIAVLGNPGFAFQGGDYARWARLEAGVWRRIAGDITGDAGNGSILFGFSVIIEGDFLVVGAPLDDPGGVDRAGSAFVFILDQQTNEWIQVQKIFASDGAVRDSFGTSIAIDGTTIAVQAAGRGAPNDGGVYMFELIDGVWQESQFILPADAVGEHPQFGRSIEIDGDRMVIGAPGFELVFIYERDENGIWQETHRPRGFMRDDFAGYGHSVALEGDRLVVGAPFEDLTNDLIDSGDFRIFDFDGTEWVMTYGGPYTVPLQQYDRLGSSVTLADSGNLIILGAPEGFKQFPGDGHMRAFRFDGEEWVEIALIRPTDQNLQVEQTFGNAMAADGNWLVVAAPGDDGGSGNNDQGAAYFYDLTGQLGTRSQLTDATVQFGTLLAGGLSSVKGSEDSRFRVRSHFGFASVEPNVADLLIGARNNVENPELINLLIEGRMTQSGGTMKVRMRNWSTNAFNQVHQYSIGTNETVQPIPDIPAGSYIRAADDRVELSLRAIAMVTFSALGFEEQIDFVNVLVHE